MPAKKIRIVTHNAGFHADDVFGVAALMLLLDQENVEVIRSRDEAIVATGDYILDVGFIYDAEKNRFDHHQEGGAGVRKNGIPYASFGLIWKKFGVNLCGSQEVADRVDRRLVQPIDAYDNGMDFHGGYTGDIVPFLVQDVLFLYEPIGWQGEEKQMAAFLEAVGFARTVLERQIQVTRHEVDLRKTVVEAYRTAQDKRLVVLPEGFMIERVLLTLILGEFPEPLLAVRQHEGGMWQAVTVVNPPSFMSYRMQLPQAWGGKHGAELVEVTGVPDAHFCHRGLFMAVAKSKEGTLKLAELALNA